MINKKPEKISPFMDFSNPIPGPAKSKLESAYESWSTNPSNEVSSQELLTALKPTIDAGLRSYAKGLENDLRTRANILAMEAVSKYNPKQGVKLNSFVMHGLKPLFRESAKRHNIIHVPENLMLERNKLEKLEMGYESDHGRSPTVEELADISGLSTKRIEYIRQVKRPAAESQFLTEKGDTLFNKQDDTQRVWVDYLYHEMDPIDKKIFEWSTGYKGAQSLKKSDIARRLKISAPAVSSRINKIIKKLEEGYSV